MEKSRKTNKIILIVLLLLIIGLSIGFAAYERELKIKTSALVQGDESGFKVVFSTKKDSATPGTIAQNGYAGAVTIGADSTELNDLKATFTEPGQTATWTFYAYNAGKFDAFLNSLTIGEITCTPKEGTDKDKVDEAAEGISIKVSVAGTDYTTTQATLPTHKLPKASGADSGEEIVVTLSYAANSAIADGDFDVTVGDIILDYGSVD